MVDSFDRITFVGGCYLINPLDMFQKTLMFITYFITYFGDFYDVFIVMRLSNVVFNSGYPERDMCIMII